MRVITITLAAMAYMTTALAQQNMSFDDALSAMLDNNSAIESAKYGADVAYNNLCATRGLRLPKIDLVGGYSLLQSDIDVDIGGSKGAVSQSINTIINKGVTDGIITSDVARLIAEGISPLMSIDWRYTLQKRSFGMIGATIVLPIYAGGSINIANRVAELTLDAETHAADAVKSRLFTELVERYYGVVVARYAREVRSDAVKAMSQHLADAKAMEEEGVVAHSVVLFLQYKLSEAERNLADATSKAYIAELALKNTIGVDEVVNPIEDMFVCNNIYNVDYYKDMALVLNPIICEAEIGAKVSDEGTKIARAAMLPEIVAMAAGAIYSHNLSDMIPRWSVGIGLRLPLFDGWGKEHRYRAAQNEAKSVHYDVENAVSNILLLVEKEYYTLCNTLTNIATTKRAITFAEAYYNNTSEGFIEGVTSSSDVVDACVELAAARVEYINAVYEYMLSLARLLEVSGVSHSFMEYKHRGEILLI